MDTLPSSEPASSFRERLLRLKKHPWFFPATLGLISILLYLPVVGFPFINFDDGSFVHQNPWFLPPTLSKLLHFWREPYMHLYAPLTYTVWGLLVPLSFTGAQPGATWEMSPLPFHAVNLVFFVGSVVFVYAILKRLTRHDWGAFAGALLFALHPAQVESVAWVTCLKGVLSGFFFLAAIHFYLLYCENDAKEGSRSNHKRASFFYLLGFVCFALALFAKGISVILPIWLATIGYFILKRPPRKLLRELTPWCVLSAIFVVIALLVHPAPSSLISATQWERGLIGLDSLRRYLAILFLPVNLTVDYGVRPEAVLKSAWLYPTLFLWLAAAAALVWDYRRRGNPWLLVGVVLFVSNLLPVSGIRPHDMILYSTIADHYLFLSLVGPALWLAWIVSRFGSRRGVGLALILGFLLLFGLSGRQERFWRSNAALFLHVLEINPASWLALDGLGDEFVGRQDLQSALALYEKALGLHPLAKEYSKAGTTHFKLGNFENAYQALTRAAALQPTSAVIAFELGRTLAKLGRFPEAQAEAIRSAKLAPGWELPRSLLSYLQAAEKSNSKPH